MQLQDAIISYLPHAPALYYRLILVVGPSRTCKTHALRAIHEGKGIPLVNLNLQVSKCLLDFSVGERGRNAVRVVDDIVRGTGGDTILLDNTEVLFDTSLQLDPLQVLQRLSRNRTVVATWNGTLNGATVTYAEASHPEYRRYRTQGILLVDAQGPQPAAT